MARPAPGGAARPAGVAMKRGWLLPKRIERPRSGIERAPQRIWPRHRRFVKSHACCVPGCLNLPVDFAHIRSAANSGKDLKPFDWFGVSLCRRHHDEQHAGVETFMQKYGIDLWLLAAEFAERSTDIAMKAAMPIVRRSYPWSPIVFPNRPQVLQ
jgi:hypothetical protein